MSDTYERLYSCILDTVQGLDDDLTLGSERDREIVADRIYDRVSYLFMVEPVEPFNARAAQLEAEAA